MRLLRLLRCHSDSLNTLHTRESALIYGFAQWAAAGWVDGSGWAEGGDGDAMRVAVGSRVGTGWVGIHSAVGAAMGGLDHLVFSRLKPTFLPSRHAAGAARWRVSACERVLRLLMLCRVLRLFLFVVVCLS